MFRRKPLALALMLAVTPALAETVDAVLPGITVLGNASSTGTLSSYSVEQEDAVAVRDSAELLATAPGVAVVRNGQQTGIVQLRGLFGERVKVQLDGMNITPACPNHMDPPMHYALPGQIDTMQVVAGVTPVSQGGDSLAGTVVVNTVPQNLFAEQGFHGKVSAGYSGANDGQNVAVTAGVAGEQAALQYRGAYLRGNDLRFPGGTVRTSGYETSQNNLTVAGKLGENHVLTLDAGAHDTKNAGNPSLPMDMVSDEASKLRAQLRGSHSWGQLTLDAYRHEIDHLMDNYTLRPVTGMKMRAPATSDDTGLAARVVLPRGDQTVRAGVEWFDNSFNSYSQNVMTLAKTDMFNNSSRERLGIYGELDQRHNSQWSSLLGLRSDTVNMDTGAIVNAGMGNPAAFNAADRSKTDNNWDMTALGRYQASVGSRYEFGFARKTRSPSILERYLWSPSNASAGQADGRTYVGNLELKPEVSNQLSASAEWSSAGWRVKPTLFYQLVDDFIQGTPTAMLDNNGRPVLKYQNVNAELYGFDGAWQVDLSKAWGLDGTFSYVRGKNRDNGDNLYRLSPLRASFNASYRDGGWQHRAEWQLASRQDKVSAYNGETPTGGYGIVNWNSRYSFNRKSGVTFGINNLFDKYYADHLGGVNRITGSDVAVGGKIPSAGRYAHVSFDWAW